MEDIEFIKQIGFNIKRIRQSKKLTQLDLAAFLNIEDSALRRIENGRTNPTIKTLLKISKALNVNINDLFKQD